MNKPLATLLLGAALAVPSVRAVTIDEAVTMLSKNLPSVDADVLSSKAEVENLRADASLPGPEVEFSYQWGLRDVGTKLNTGISQSFDWPGVYQSRHKAVKAAEETGNAIESARRRQVASQLRVLLTEYIAARARYQTIGEIDTLLGRVEATMHKAYEGGELTLLDLNKLKIARATMSHELHLAESSLSDLEGTISETSETDSHDILTQLDDIQPELSIPTEDEYMAKAILFDPDILANIGSARNAEIAAEIEKRSNYPGFSAGYTFSHEQGETFHGFALGVTLPSRANARKAAAARLEAESAIAAKEGALASHRARYRALVANAEILRDAIARLKPVFEKYDNMRLLEKAYEGGQISVLDFLQELDYFSQARLDYLGDIGQYYVTLSKLNIY